MAAAAALGVSSVEAASLLSVVRVDARSGRLVRSVVVTRDAPEVVRAMVEEAARNYEVSPELVDSVIQVESNYNPYAVSPKGAQGLMQLMPKTARRFGVSNSFDAKQNIEGGVKYLKFLQDTFQDDRLAIAAYNAGEGAVTKYGRKVPPYKETVEYVARVGRKMGQARKVKSASVAAQTVAKNEPPAEQHPALLQYVDAEGRLHLSTQ